MESAAKKPAAGYRILGEMNKEFSEILTSEACEFIAELSRKFLPQVQEFLKAREIRQQEIKAGKLPDFLPETKNIRESDWKIAGIPSDLQDRRVEITGPVDRKMIINAMNSGAKVFMADFEDSHTPTWENTIQGQLNLQDAINGAIAYESPEGKKYHLNKTGLATLIVRPRGWHLAEKHFLVDGEPILGALFDFGLYFFHNHKKLLAKKTAPYFYLPKLESHKEARVWAEIFAHTERKCGLKKGTIKVTVLIETILAAFEIDEILYELRDYAVGLNCGRWDYIFSFIKKFSNDPKFILPDRAKVAMTSHFLRLYSLLLIKTCHRRGAFAMGGMAAFIPIKNDPAANEEAIANVKADKEREAGDGHDGTWVAHPGLISTAKEVFDRLMPGQNQLARLRDDVNVTAADLLQVPAGEITEAGLRNNIAVSIRYLESWLRGVGCVPIFNLMEDAATAEIARAQIWQWIRHKAKLATGETVTAEMFKKIMDEELEKIRREVGEAKFSAAPYEKAYKFLESLVLSPKFPEFLTLGAYGMLD